MLHSENWQEVPWNKSGSEKGCVMDLTGLLQGSQVSFLHLLMNSPLSCYHEISLFQLGMSLRNQNLWQQQLTLKRPFTSVTQLHKSPTKLKDLVQLSEYMIMNYEYMIYNIYVYIGHILYTNIVYIYICTC